MENIVLRASQFAFLKHKGQIDESGLPYFESHIMQVVNILSCVTRDPKILSAAYLHDTVEDTDTKYEELVELFGVDIANLVMEVTQDGTKDHIGYYFPRLHSQSAIMIKFADRLSNLSRMECWDVARREHYMKRSKFWKSSPTDKLI